MRHFASPSFWSRYENLPQAIKNLANRNFKLLKANPKHPSLHLKKVGKYYSVRIGKKYLALAVEIGEGLLWFWIGTHSEYDKLML